MTIKAIIKKLEDAPEGLREHYTEKDGVFVLSIEGMQDHPENVGLKKALDDEKELRRKRTKEADDLKKKLEAIPEDFDIDEYNRLKDGGGGNIDEKLKEQRERMSASHKKEIDGVKAELTEANDLINSHVKLSTLRRVMNEANIHKPYLGAVEALLTSRITIEGKGKDAVVLLDDKPIDEAMKSWASSEDGKVFVAAPGNGGGGGGRGPGGGGQQNNPWKKDSLNLTEQGRIQRENPELARQLASEAGKSI
jgi:hypothetical protein